MNYILNIHCSVDIKRNTYLIIWNRNTCCGKEHFEIALGL